MSVGNLLVNRAADKYAAAYEKKQNSKIPEKGYDIRPVGMADKIPFA